MLKISKELMLKISKEHIPKISKAITSKRAIEKISNLIINILDTPILFSPTPSKYLRFIIYILFSWIF